MKGNRKLAGQLWDAWHPVGCWHIGCFFCLGAQIVYWLRTDEWLDADQMDEAAGRASR